MFFNFACLAEIAIVAYYSYAVGTNMALSDLICLIVNFPYVFRLCLAVCLVSNMRKTCALGFH